MNTSDCYHILGIQSGASQKEIKSAYRRLSLKYHPDKTKDESDTERFKKIVEAYQQLRAEEKKSVKASETEVASKYTDFWKKYDKEESNEFHFGPDFSRFRNEFGANDGQFYEHNQEKESSPFSTHAILYGGLGAIALWIILSSILK